MTIFLPIFALLTAVGAWQAWRRSPLYSTKIALKMMGVTLLLAAAIGGFTLGIFSGPMSRSPAAQAIVGLLGFLLLTTCAMVLVVRITDSHVARLPASAHLATLHRRKVQKWVWRFLVFELVSGAAAMAVPADWQWLPLLIGGFPLLVCSPMLAIFYMMARRNDRGMTAVMTMPWIHWRYPKGQWEAWAKDQVAWERSKVGTAKSTLRSLAIPFAIVVPLLSLGAWMSGGSFLENAAIVGGMTAFLALIFGGLAWYGLGMPERDFRRIAAAPAEAYFGDEGFYSNGEYMPWLLSGQYLVEAKMAGDAPPRLTLAFQSFNGNSSRLIEKRVALPEGGALDLPVLQQKLAARCPKAAVRLVRTVH
jgi:hypothetical protein